MAIQVLNLNIGAPSRRMQSGIWKLVPHQILIYLS